MTEYEEWLKTRPECVQKLAAEFPLGTTVQDGGKTYYMIGWTEGDMLIVSEYDPYTDYDKAEQNREYICCSHLRNPA